MRFQLLSSYAVFGLSEAGELSNGGFLGGSIGRHFGRHYQHQAIKRRSQVLFKSIRRCKVGTSSTTAQHCIVVGGGEGEICKMTCGSLIGLDMCQAHFNKQSG